MKKIFLVVLTLILCFCAAFVVAVSAENAPETDIVAHNLALNDSVNIIYYADFQNVPENAEKGILIWTSARDEYIYGSENAKLTTVRGISAGYPTYAFTGVSAKMMSQDIYAKSYIKVGDEIIYGPLDKYSVLQYCYNKKGSTTTVNGGTKTLGELVEKMLEYGAFAQEYFNYNTDRMANATYYKIDVVNGTLADGMTSGLFVDGGTVTLYAETENFCHWENGNTFLSANSDITITVTENATYTATASHIEIIDASVAPNCTETGLTEGKHCSVCGEVLLAQSVIPALGHSWDDGVVTTPATTTATGVMTYTCTVCGKTKTESIPVIVLYTREGDYIYFGSYPQSEVTESGLKSTLNSKAGTLPTSSNSQKWTSYGYYISGSVSDYMWYIDVTEGGEQYRGVYFTSYRPYYMTNSSGPSTYQYDNGYTINNVYWFKYEPLKWRILSESDGKALILCESIIDSQQYYRDYSSHTINGNTVYANNYEYSDIRAWLNETFYETAFNDLQKALIETTTVDNSARSTSPNNTLWNNGINIYACNNTYDKIFLLSEQDVTNSAYGFNSSASNYDTVRRKQNTDYSKVQGVYTYSGGSYDGNSWWWLRSPDYRFSNSAREVYYGGNANYADTVANSSYGVVPALQIRL